MSDNEQALQVIERNDETDLAIFGENMRLPAVEQQRSMLAEYSERRTCFRQWLLGQLKQGIHFGFPPGCESRFDEQGNLLQFNRKTGQWLPVPKSQWQARPSLYKSGALFLVDLLRLKAEYTSDLDGWHMMGDPKGAFVRTCTLFSARGEKIGCGTGVFSIGDKRMDANAAMKMADKRALVAAVINSLAVCADLFTQDTEDLAQGKPSAAANTAPSSDEFGALVAAWLVEIVAGSPLEGYELSDEDIKSLKAKIKLWTAPTYPANAQEAIEWCRSHVNVRAMEDQNGQITGIKFVKAHK